jgi:hypothetical protein
MGKKCPMRNPSLLNTCWTKKDPSGFDFLLEWTSQGKKRLGGTPCVEGHQLVKNAIGASIHFY